LQALRQEYDVSLITCGPVDLARLNVYYGTRLQPRDFTVHRVRLPLGIGVKGRRLAAVQGHVLQRYCQHIARQFDVMISAYNPCSFGVPAIQFVSDFAFVPEWRFSIHPTLQGRRRWWYADSPLRKTYLGLCNLISRSDPTLFQRDMVVANSAWSARLIREKFGIGARTLYPPVVGDFPSVLEGEKENGFVCLGRLVPEKRILELIGILQRVRETGGENVHLHILGTANDSRYERALRETIARHCHWIFFEGTVYGHKKKELLARHRFGIHGCRNEAFGIAVAEMVKAGCIVFVPDGGGQTEIVDHPDLIYEDDETAVTKIVAALRDSAMQSSLRKHLRQKAQGFSTDIFQQGLLDLTRQFLERRGAQDDRKA
jgi:glycosyltransferase involved in cell wall biosynthesis